MSVMKLKTKGCAVERGMRGLNHFLVYPTHLSVWQIRFVAEVSAL
jgi:hypothetical protein